MSIFNFKSDECSLVSQAKARSREKIVSSPDRLPLCVEETRRSPEVVPPRVDLEALGMLPLQRQREYLELKTKLALYAKKQREEEMAVKGIYIKCSGTPLIQTPMGQKKVSILVRCPYFRWRKSPC